LPQAAARQPPTVVRAASTTLNRERGGDVASTSASSQDHVHNHVRPRRRGVHPGRRDEAHAIVGSTRNHRSVRIAVLSPSQPHPPQDAAEIVETLNSKCVPPAHGTNRWTPAMVRKAYVS
jgi:hypothetical protein